MKLTYKAVTRDGKTQRGIIDAKDINEAATYLRGKELLPIQIEAQDKFSKYLPFRKKVKSKDVALFTRQLSSTITAGITLSKSLDILKEQISNLSMVDVINALIADIQEGSSFSKAIEKHPTVFSPIYISIVRAGESSGLLDKVLLRLADNLEKQQKLRSTIKSALMYPAVVVTMMVIVVFRHAATCGSLQKFKCSTPLTYEDYHRIFKLCANVLADHPSGSWRNNLRFSQMEKDRRRETCNRPFYFAFSSIWKTYKTINFG